ncbi:MAG TPA: NAD-dependent malic enzyme, partial [Deinococcales bacterium]|nr:NAD-dependent malic enzyme [Deinococcales bacterium]
MADPTLANPQISSDEPPPLPVALRGRALLHDPLLNKSSAFPADERQAFGLEGLLPPHVATLEIQLERVYEGYGRQTTPLDRHLYLRALQDRNETLFFALLDRHLEEMLPIVYTPTVGEAIEKFSHLYQRPRGLTVAQTHLDDLGEILSNAAPSGVDLIVATDSEGILGIGDQGVGGLGISIGKLAIYTVAAGIPPARTLPVALDVGTDRKDLLADPLYLGARHERLRGEAYDRLLQAFVSGVRRRFPRALVQWEDFSKDRAFHVLESFAGSLPSFNDDIQGTGAMSLGGVLAAMRGTGAEFTQQVFAVLGAGAGGVGVARALRDGLVSAGLSLEAATARVFVLDSRGLVMRDRPGLEPYKLEFARVANDLTGWHTGGGIPNLLEVIQNAGVTAVMGLSGHRGTIDEAMVRAMTRNTPNPIVFALSNPTSATEILPEEALAWSDGRAIVATGSPFPAASAPDGRRVTVGQGTNAFIFPGVGLGALAVRARRVTPAMLTAAGQALAGCVSSERLEQGAVFPAT